MKKIFLLAAGLLLLCIFVFSSCNTDTTPENSDVKSTLGATNGNSDVKSTLEAASGNNNDDTSISCQHSFGEWETKKEATCKKEGKQIRTCEKCGETQTQAIPTNDEHTVVTDDAVAATCKNTGLTEGSHCSLCGKVFVAQEPTEKTEHKYVDNVCECGDSIDSVGLAFTKSGNSYTLSGIGECTDARIVVPATYDNLPVTKVAASAFSSVNSFYEIILPSSVHTIGAKAFSGCKQLKSVTILGKVQWLERETFSGCSALESIKLPSELLQIMESCFASCTSLERIDLPHNLLKIREYAFYNCSKLKELTLPSSLNEIQQFAFLDCRELYFKYSGMYWQFKQTSKGFAWNEGTPSSFITCADGEFDIYYG